MKIFWNVRGSAAGADLEGVVSGLCPHTNFDLMLGRIGEHRSEWVNNMEGVSCEVNMCETGNQWQDLDRLQCTSSG